VSGPLLSVRDLGVRYGPIVAVDGFDLDVDGGEIVALLGANGAGKSSILRAISGLESFTGRIEYDGSPVRARPDRLARRGLIHVPEGRRILPTLTVHENLQVAASARGRRAGASEEDVYDLFPMLVPLRDRGGWALSGGEQQMLAIGRALVGAPRLLLLDEPSLGLAPAIARVVFDAIAEIGGSLPVVLVEQNTAVALEICTRAVVLAEGRVVMRGGAEEIAESDELLGSYLGTSHAADD
jgi:branched-chain amino acid transport system ATP-binding protein